ncbi:MAG: type II toxin-antitoxin system HicA family toxin [Chloroflexi bacterium]|nr:type II toxin-antitoxin system HicA family toxin [Gemmatimonadota bacterium]MBA4170856.1 type II toxin-antitoxin system HicA family toxin [Chloroflexota bacterium]
MSGARSRKMGRCAAVVEKARSSPSNLRFEEAVSLAECLGFEHVRTTGSHQIFTRAGFEGRPLNLQRVKGGKAKKRQVEQLLKVYDARADEEQ